MTQTIKALLVTTPRQVIRLVGIIISVALIITSVAIFSSYRTGIEQIEQQLVTLVRSEVSLLRTLERIESAHLHETIFVKRAEIIGAVANAHEQLLWPTKSQEIMIGEKRGDQKIAFLFRTRYREVLAEKVVRIGEEIAKPMQLALTGKSGVVVALDYKGILVLAAYDFMPELQLGVVAKIDLAEVRRPFIIVAIATLVVVIIAIVIGGLLSIRIIRSIAWKMQKEVERLRLMSVVAEFSPVSVIMTDSSGAIIYVNPAFAVVTGYSEDEVRGQNLSILTGKKTIVDSTREVLIIHKNGKTLPVEICVREFQVDGEPCFIWVIRDLTEHKKANKEKEYLQRELLRAESVAGFAVMATDVLHNLGNLMTPVVVGSSALIDGLKSSRLPRLQQVLDLMPIEPTEIVRFITDDFRGRKIIGYLRDLSEHLLNEKQGFVKKAQAIIATVDEIGRIITAQQQLAAREPTPAEEIFLPEIIQQIIDLHADSFLRHGIDVRLEFDQKISYAIITVRQLLIQILGNLVWNARDSLRDDDVSSKLLTIRLTCDTEFTTITVIDNGGGIHPDHLSEIFKHGFTTKATGRGFGLHSVLLAVREIGGEIDVKSDGPGQGACFKVQLPS